MGSFKLFLWSLVFVGLFVIGFATGFEKSCCVTEYSTGGFPAHNYKPRVYHGARPEVDLDKYEESDYKDLKDEYRFRRYKEGVPIDIIFEDAGAFKYDLRGGGHESDYQRYKWEYFEENRYRIDKFRSYGYKFKNREAHARNDFY